MLRLIFKLCLLTIVLSLLEPTCGNPIGLLNPIDPRVPLNYPSFGQRSLDPQFVNPDKTFLPLSPKAHLKSIVASRVAQFQNLFANINLLYRTLTAPSAVPRSGDGPSNFITTVPLFLNIIGFIHNLQQDLSNDVQVFFRVLRENPSSLLGLFEH